MTHPVQANADAPHSVAPAVAPSNHTSNHASNHVENDPQHELTAAPERVEVRRYADVQG
jgi:hypothetical protein